MSHLTKPVVLRVSDALIVDFDAVCASAGISRSAALRQLMQRAVDEFNGVVPLFGVGFEVAPGDGDESSIR